MKLWLDDIRYMPPGYHLWAKNISEAFRMIRGNDITFISFDHDLGDERANHDGACVAKYVEWKVRAGHMRCPDWAVHSSNPVGRDNINRIMESVRKYCDG